MAAAAAGLRALEPWSPRLTARLAVPLMFRTMRRAPSGDERARLARGTRFTVRSAGRNLAAWSFGEGPTVLLVHGWNGRGGQLAALVPPLVAGGFRVVLFDGPGHGASPGHASSLLELADALDDVVERIASLFAPLHAIVAHSMGGAAVTYAMRRALGAPPGSRERALRDELPARRFVFFAPPIDVRDFVASFARAVRLGDETQRAIVEGIERRFAISLASLHAPTLAEELRAPLLVVHDEDDREVPVACGRRLAAAWPGAQLVVTHGLGHQRILRDEAVIDQVLTFLVG